MEDLYNKRAADVLIKAYDTDPATKSYKMKNNIFYLPEQKNVDL